MKDILVQLSTAGTTLLTINQVVPDPSETGGLIGAIVTMILQIIILFKKNKNNERKN